MTFDEFKTAVKQWANETRMMSFHRPDEPQCQEILKHSIPVAWACLMLEDDSIFQAFTLLGQLVPRNEHPEIPEYYHGRVPVVLECYRYWALKEGHVATKYDPSAYWVEDKNGNRGNWH